MCAETKTDLTSNVYELMGYDSEAKKVRMGMLAEKTHPYIKEMLKKTLIKQGFSEWEASSVLSKTWKDTPENMQIKESYIIINGCDEIELMQNDKFRQS